MIENQKKNSQQIDQLQIQNFQSENEQNTERIFDGTQFDQEQCSEQKKGEPQVSIDPIVMYEDTIKIFKNMNDSLIQVEMLNNVSKIHDYETAKINLNSKNIVQPSNQDVNFKVNLLKQPKNTQNKLSQNQTTSIKRISIKANQNQLTQKFKDSIKNDDLSQKQIKKIDTIKSISNQQETLKKLLNKRVRVQSSSMLSRNSKLVSSNAHQKLIPLEQIKKQPPSFFQLIYRLKIQNFQVWQDQQKNFKRQNTKKIFDTKQMKNFVFKAYDYDGQLIPAYNTNEKRKKTAFQNNRIEVKLSDDVDVQNLRPFNQRSSKIKMSLGQLQKKHPQLNEVESNFMKNFKNLQWKNNINLIEIQQKDTEKIISGMKNCYESKKTKSFTTYKTVNKPKNEKTTGKRKSNEEKLLEQFQRIKSNQKQVQEKQKENQEENMKFQYSFSKYIKAKRFLEKQTKSKSYNCETHKCIHQRSQNQNENTILKPKKPVKGPQKVKANKRLFKELFNVSLKRILPANREDIATIKLINTEEKQNTNFDETKISQQPIRKLNFGRISDPTTLLKNKDLIQNEVLNQFKNKKKQQTNKVQKIRISDAKLTSQSKTLSEYAQITNLEYQSTNKQNSYKINQRVSKRKISLLPQHQDFVEQNVNNEAKKIQKLFKKETKKTLFKQTLKKTFSQNFQ